MKVKIPNKMYDLGDFYDAVAKELGYTDVSNLRYDCRKINVAPNIQNNFFEYYKGIAPDDITEEEVRTHIALSLLVYGPKVDETLTNNEVEVFDGFIC